MSLFLQILTIILVGITTIVCQEIKCEKDAKKFDNELVDYFLFAAPTKKFPNNQAEMKEFCAENDINASRIKAYANKCMDKLLKRLTSLATYSIQKTNANVCRSRRRSADFMEMGKCGNAAIKDSKKCWNAWMKSSSAIGLITDGKLRLPLVCCITYVMRDCLSQSYENNKQCNKKSREGMEALFGYYLTNTLKLMCGDYSEDSDKCDKIIGKLPKLKSKTPNSVVSLLLTVFDGIPEDDG